MRNAAFLGRNFASRVTAGIGRRGTAEKSARASFSSSSSDARPASASAMWSAL